MRPAFFVAILLASGLGSSPPMRAQTPMVLPSSMQGVEGAAASMLPFGLTTGVRYQILYQEPHIGGQRRFTEIAFRADWNGGQPIPAKQYVWLHLTVTNVPLRWDAMTGDFDHNFAKKIKSQVLDARVALPALPALAQGPRPFDIRIKFDAPEVFVQDWGEGNVLVEILVLGQPQGRYPLDSCFVCESRRTSFGRLDPSCSVQHPGGPKPLLVDAAPSTKLGQTMTFTLENALPDALCMLMIGTQREGGSYLGQTLPFDVFGMLDPQRRGQDPAPGCFVNTDWIFLFPRVANAQGRASAGLAIPGDERWLNVFLTCQALTLDFGANRLGFAFSKAVQSNVCGPLPVAVAFATFTDRNKIPTQGAVLHGEAPVIELR